MQLYYPTKQLHIYNKGYFMEKVRFERFINKYNLGGVCESVLYNVQNGVLSTRGISEDNTVLCEVTAPSFGLPDGQYPVYETSRIRAMLGVLANDLGVVVRTSDTRPVSLTFTDGNVDATFVLADSSVIPAVPTTKIPPFDITLNIDEYFITSYIKAKAALPEATTFTLVSDGSSDEVDVVLGFSALNTNRIKLTASLAAPAPLEPISFSAKYFREILVANKDARSGTMAVSSKGIAVATFEVDDIVSTYYLVRIVI
jgi:hypothetical protein